MTIFSDNPHDRRMERLMMTVPNFAPRGVDFRFTEAQVFITVTAATPTEILTATMRQIRCPPFRKRFNEYIESEEKPMTYINEKHRARFTLAAKNISKTNYALLSALYLLTLPTKGCGAAASTITIGSMPGQAVFMGYPHIRSTVVAAEWQSSFIHLWPSIGCPDF